MTTTVTPATRIMEVLAHSDGCLLEDLEHECPDLTWNQLFLEVDRLSRSGEVGLRLRGAGQYVVTVSRSGSLGIPVQHITQGGSPYERADTLGAV